jgi:tetratricopeptide (TPR) repeat protein
MLLALLLLLANPESSHQVQDLIQAGVAASDRGDLVGAQAKFEEATRVAADNAGAWLLLAQVQAKRSDVPGAVASAQKAEKLAGNDPDVLRGLAHFYEVLHRDPAKAAGLAARYAEAAPQDLTAWRRAAGLYLEVGDADRAIAAATRGLKSDPGAELHSLLGRAYLARKDFANAAAELKRALDLNPYDEQAHFRLAQVHLFQQDFVSAIRVLENARTIFDKSPQLELALGVADYGARNFPAAVDQFLRTMALAPDLPQPYVFLGRILEHAAGRLPEIAARFAAFRERNPQNPLGYVLEAKVQVQQLPPEGYPPEAAGTLELLKKALSLAPGNAEAHYLLGVLLDRKGEVQDAAAHLEKSIALNPKEPAPHYRLARVYTRLGRREDAAEQRRLHEKLSEEESAPAGRGTVAGPRSK